MNVDILNQDVWGVIMSQSYFEFIDFKTCRLISKTFADTIVEKGSEYVLRTLQLNKNEKISSFRRILNLENLIQQWINPKDAETILKEGEPPDQGPRTIYHAYVEGFRKLSQFGINPINYMDQPLDVNNLNETWWDRPRKKLLKYQRSIVIKEFKKWSFSLSPKGFLSITQTHIRADNDNGLSIRIIAQITPHVFPKHPGQEDFCHLMTRNLSNLPLALVSDPAKANKLLNEKFSELDKHDIVGALLFYLLNHDTKGLFAFLKNHDGRLNIAWQSDEIDKEFPGFSTCFSSLVQEIKNPKIQDSEQEIKAFAKLLIVLRKNIEASTQKCIISHVAESGNAQILNALIAEKYDLSRHLDCFHYAKTAEIADILFHSNANTHLNGLKFRRYPITTALMKKNYGAAASFIRNGAYIQQVSSLHLLKFLIPRTLSDITQDISSKWIVLKELAYRAAIIAAFAVGILTAMAGIIALSYALYQAIIYIPYAVGLIPPERLFNI